MYLGQKYMNPRFEVSLNTKIILANLSSGSQNIFLMQKVCIPDCKVKCFLTKLRPALTTTKLGWVKIIEDHQPIPPPPQNRGEHQLQLTKQHKVATQKLVGGELHRTDLGLFQPYLVHQFWPHIAYCSLYKKKHNTHETFIWPLLVEFCMGLTKLNNTWKSRKI